MPTGPIGEYSLAKYLGKWLGNKQGESVFSWVDVFGNKACIGKLLQG